MPYNPIPIRQPRDYAASLAAYHRAKQVAFPLSTVLVKLLESAPCLAALELLAGLK